MISTLNDNCLECVAGRFCCFLTRTRHTAGLLADCRRTREDLGHANGRQEPDSLPFVE